MLGNLRRYTASTSKRFATRHRGEGLKRGLVALRWDKPERLRSVAAWQPSPLRRKASPVGHSGYLQALRNAPGRRGLKALAVHRKGIAVVRISGAARRNRSRFQLPLPSGESAGVMGQPRDHLGFPGTVNRCRAHNASHCLCYQQSRLLILSPRGKGWAAAPIAQPPLHRPNQWQAPCLLRHTRINARRAECSVPACRQWTGE